MTRDGVTGWSVAGPYDRVFVSFAPSAACRQPWWSDWRRAGAR
ncbi:hypothetical protein [Streptomyces mutabilis]|nr:hypothetical protein [Streptomyces mutabilis]